MSQPLLRESDQPAPGAVLTLDQVERGERVEVIDIVPADPSIAAPRSHASGEGRGEDQTAQRLEDLGVRAGIVIEVRRRAPLGDPTVFELCGYQLCLRRSESSRVRVRALPASDAPGTTATR